MNNEYEHDETEHLRETDKILKDFQELIIKQERTKQDNISH